MGAPTRTCMPLLTLFIFLRLIGVPGRELLQVGSRHTHDRLQLEIGVAHDDLASQADYPTPTIYFSLQGA